MTNDDVSRAVGLLLAGGFNRLPNNDSVTALKLRLRDPVFVRRVVEDITRRNIEYVMSEAGFVEGKLEFEAIYDPVGSSIVVLAKNTYSKDTLNWLNRLDKHEQLIFSIDILYSHTAGNDDFSAGIREVLNGEVQAIDRIEDIQSLLLSTCGKAFDDQEEMAVYRGAFETVRKWCLKRAGGKND